MMTTPFSYQIEDVRELHRMGGRCLVAWDPGLGKSFLSLWYGQRRQRRPITVVCPASLKWNWERECQKHFGWRAAVLSGRRPAKRERYHDEPVTVINYDILHDWLPTLQEYGSELVVLDESQKLSGRVTRRTKAARDLCRGVKSVLALSGTPILNRPADLFPTLNILRPDLFRSFFPYALEFCNAKKSPWGWDFRGSSNTAKLHGILKEKMMVRRRKADVLTHLPPVLKVIVPVEVSDRKQYDLAHKEFVVWLARHKPEKMNAALRAERMVRAGYLRRLVATLKQEAIYEWADSFLESGDEKIILFGVHREAMVDPTYDRYRKVAEVIHGGVVGQKRQENFDRFLKDPRKRVLVGNIEAAGVGLSALGVSNTAFLELAWRPSDHDQAADRTHGVGRGVAGVQSTSYWFVARKTIEEHVLGILDAKRRTAVAVIDGGAPAGDDLVADLLHEKLTGEGT